MKWLAVLVAGSGAVACSNPNAPSTKPGTPTSASSPAGSSGAPRYLRGLDVSVKGTFTEDGRVLVEIANQGKKPATVQTASPALLHTALNGRSERWVTARQFQRSQTASYIRGTEVLASGQGSRMVINPREYVTADGGSPVRYNPRDGKYAFEIEVNGKKFVRPVEKQKKG